MDQSTTGLYPKFHVSRADGRDQPGGDRAGADYLVMDLTYDEHAVPAALSYADSCRERYPQLASDIVAKVFAPQERSGDEFWSHRCVDWIRDGFDVRAWLEKYGFEYGYRMMEAEPDADLLFKTYQETEKLLHWIPTPPAGDGWMPIAIDDTDDGPVAAWIRKKVEA
ncbi:hypothetical protein [Chromobacterium phragmitis]|uniref:Uncharacterized protein n=1 Tax=Chromobacterium phragmitis TaxID=2202141 RepID=A0A344UPF8_9NEIS|nr:hypothetical protein [Chromobacterium phragmitis]AXE37156.1 hypothetical protein DK843_22665 [Chromobacterium phragmitis]